MNSSPRKLPAIPLPGLRPDSLGDYLASLGLLRVLARKWPEVRIAWKEEVLHVVGGPDRLHDLLDQLMEVAKNKRWTPYERGWADTQKECTQVKSGTPLAVWQSEIAEEALELFVAHAVPSTREVHFNLLLGRGGNADRLGKSRRVFANGWRKAVNELAGVSEAKARKKPTKNSNSSCDIRSELHSWLMGQPLGWMVEGLNAASWFSHANKLYNTARHSRNQTGVAAVVSRATHSGCGIKNLRARKRIYGLVVQDRGHSARSPSPPGPWRWHARGFPFSRGLRRGDWARGRAPSEPFRS